MSSGSFSTIFPPFHYLPGDRWLDFVIYKAQVRLTKSTLPVRGDLLFDFLTRQLPSNIIAIGFDLTMTRQGKRPYIGPFLTHSTHISFTRPRVRRRPVMIVFDICLNLLRDSAFRMLFQVGCFYGAMERCRLE